MSGEPQPKTTKGFRLAERLFSGAMEQLKALQRKSALLRILEETWAASKEEQDLLAETLQAVILALQSAFGSETLQRLGLLRRFFNLVGELNLSNLVSLCSETTLPQAGRLCDQKCEVSIEGVDLAQSALEDFVNSYYMFHGLNPESTRDVLKYLPILGFVESHNLRSRSGQRGPLASARRDLCQHLLIRPSRIPSDLCEESFANGGGSRNAWTGNCTKVHGSGPSSESFAPRSPHRKLSVKRIPSTAAMWKKLCA